LALGMSRAKAAAYLAVAGILVTLVLAGITAYWNAWTNRPIVDYCLGETTKSYAYNPGYPLPFQLSLKDTGQNDIVVWATISAVNATISSKSTGNYAPSSLQSILVNAHSDWGSTTLYAMPNPNVTSFIVTISGITYANTYKKIDSVSSFVMYMVVSQTTWTALTPQTLTYVKNGEAANTYSLAD
jgi:hypothetical protein